MTGDENQQTIKCVVWDLDHTLWDGVLLEDPEVRLRPFAVEVLKALDARGILHSIASRNDHSAVMTKLQEFGLWDYFLYPQIHWNSKAASIQHIAKALNFSLDAMAFVDDQAFERDEVASSNPQVLCLDATQIPFLPELPRMQPRFITGDSSMRRALYQNDIQRNEAEVTFSGTNEEFLASLGMVFTIARASEDDLQRAEELTLRTHQLNSTGYTYSYEELNEFQRSPSHLLLISSLSDRYGPYGKIGLALVDCGVDAWTIKLLLMSCRVMSRGVGTIMLNYIMGLAKAHGVRLLAEFARNERNRMMHITYKFAGFSEAGKTGRVDLLENDLTSIQKFPSYVKVIVCGKAEVPTAFRLAASI